MIALVARTLSRVEHDPKQTGTWYEVKCGRCRSTFQIEAHALDKIITRYGYVFCANAFCAERLYAMPHEAVGDLEARRSRS